MIDQDEWGGDGVILTHPRPGIEVSVRVKAPASSLGSPPDDRGRRSDRSRLFFEEDPMRDPDDRLRLDRAGVAPAGELMTTPELSILLIDDDVELCGLMREFFAQ